MYDEQQPNPDVHLPVPPDFEEALRASAPLPRSGFEAQLSAQLRRDHIQRRQARAVLTAVDRPTEAASAPANAHAGPRTSAPAPASTHPTLRTPIRRPAGHRRSLRLLVAAAILVIAGGGAALAVYTQMQQLIQDDAGLQTVLDRGLGHEVGLRQTVGDFTVTLDWAYADDNRLTLAYSLRGRPGVQYASLESAPYAVTVRGSDTALSFVQGTSVLLDARGQVITDLDALTSANGSMVVRTYDLGGLALDDREALDLRVELTAYGVANRQRMLIPFDAAPLMQSSAFGFEFSVPLAGQRRALRAPQTATAQDITLTLREVVVTPSQTRLRLCFTPPDPARQWLAIAALTTDAGEVMATGGARPFVEGDQHCQDALYTEPLFEVAGRWRLMVTELVGFGAGGGADQVRVAGAWLFDFTIPQ